MLITPNKLVGQLCLELNNSDCIALLYQGALFGGISGLCFNILLCAGSMVFPPYNKPLAPLPVDGCPALDMFNETLTPNNQSMVELIMGNETQGIEDYTESQ